MKIDPSITPSLNGNQDAQAAANPRVQAGSDKPASTGSDTISLSALSSQMHAIESNLTSSGEFDPGKVSAIKQAITDGKLTVNAGVVADKLIAATQELLNKQP